MKYSNRYNEVFDFYYRNIGVFDFCGTLNPKYEAIPSGSLSAKECFYLIDSQGVNKPCSEPELLNKLLLTKAAVNFQIKEWAQGRADCTLPLVEFSKREMAAKYPDININSECKVLAWSVITPKYYNDIEEQYSLPEWVISAVEKQKVKYYA